MALYRRIGSPWDICTRYGSTFDKILIANRGEIACRIIRTAKKMGIRTVGVFSDVDASSMHVAQADESYNIGAPQSTTSYLRGENLIKIAIETGCKAIHPGYGFLSENAEFADMCKKNGVVFIGPPSGAIKTMGIKSTSKAIMTTAGVPVVEGYHGYDQTDATLKKEADIIGYPLMIKAVRGGGGKGMRIVNFPKDFHEALDAARREAQNSFNDSIVLLEKFITEPRHIEVQIFADSHGNAIHLFERDCSVQRRHQKVIEEAPAPKISEQLREELGVAAVKAAKAVGYVGAGTVEFILDMATKKFYFMEMNTRLQVEHPITEMITGVDLVEWQIKIASGKHLPVKEVKKKGHAFEARIYAEDPRNNFYPVAGTLSLLTTPKPSPDVRIETGVRQGDAVSIYYDPMIAKLVVWGETRKEALMKMEANLAEYNIGGLETNVDFLLSVCRHPEFHAGRVHTNFIRDHFKDLFSDPKITNRQLIQASLAKILCSEIKHTRKVINGDSYNPFLTETGYRINYYRHENIKLFFNKEGYNVAVRRVANKDFKVSVNDGKWLLVKGKLHQEGDKLILISTIEGCSSHVNLYMTKEYLLIFGKDGKIKFDFEKPKYLSGLDESSSVQSLRAVAPMTGVLEKLYVKEGDDVREGDPLFIINAMKMEYTVKAPFNARIKYVHFNTGANVKQGTTVVDFKK